MDKAKRRADFEGLLAFLIFVVAPLATIFVSRSIVAIALGSALVIWILIRQGRWNRFPLFGIAPATAGKIAGLGFLFLFGNILVSIDRQETLLEIAKRFPVVLGGIILYDIAKGSSFNRLAMFPVAGSFLALGLLTFYLDGWFGYIRPTNYLAYDNFMFNRSLVVSTVVACTGVALLSLSERSFLKSVLIVLLVGMLLQTLLISDSQTALLYLLFFCFSATFFRFFPKTIGWVKYGIVVVLAMAPLVLLIPDTRLLIELDNPITNLLLQSASPESRLQIWRGFASLIWQKPLLGWGLGTESMVSEFVGDALPSGVLSHHPHSMPVQLWFNAGFVGVVLFVVAIWAFLTRVENADSDYAVFAMSFFVATFACWCFGHGAWQSWWLVLIMLPYFALLSFKSSAPGLGHLTRAVAGDGQASKASSIR